MLTYSNKKGKQVELTVTRHAYIKFIERYPRAFPDDPLQKESLPGIFERIFSTTTKVKNLNRCERKRLQKHGQDSMFFRTNAFTFVVQNAKVITVELSDNGKRHLNKAIA